jgi:predicted  nucleic acid-binding Zn-ribbon protein
MDGELDQKISELGTCASRVHDLEQNVEEKQNYIDELESCLKTREAEVTEQCNLLDNTRSLHTEHCRELERQIDQVCFIKVSLSFMSS